MKIYYYSDNVYTKNGIAEKCPITGDYLIPANATTIEPPQVDLPSKAMWANELQKWEVFTPPPTPPPPPEQIIAGFTTAIQQRLDDFAKSRGYDGILSACTYATSKVAKFAAEGQTAVNARDNTWEAAGAILADVEAGNRAIPTIDELMLDMPPLSW